MADESKLKEVYGHIEAGEAEMERYRAGLAAKLAAAKPARVWPRLVWLAVPIAAVLILAIFRSEPQPVFTQHTPREVQALLAGSAHPDRLQVLAEHAYRKGHGEERLNATMALCLMRPVASGIYLAAEGLRQDPRPTFRTFYLEYLLDYADDYQINEDEVESLMDKETNALCLSLYDDLLKIS